MITILDGGMGSELRERGYGSADGLWSAQALLDAPDMVLQVHRDYIAAGADIITSNSYSTIPSYLGKRAMAGRYVELTRLAGEIARAAASGAPRPVRVAGSLPPLGESYRPDLIPEEAESLEIYRAMVEALRDSVDLFLCETLSSGAEARRAVGQALAFGGGKPVLVSWTLDETPGAGLRSGEPVAEAFAQLAGYEVAAYLFNCTQPEAILAGVRELAQLTDRPIGGYPNLMAPVNRAWTLDNELQTATRTDLDIDDFVALVARIVAAGATIVGGCCRVGPRHIAALRARFAPGRDAPE